MRKRIWILLALAALVLTTILPSALITGTSSTLQCVPYNNQIRTETVDIVVGLNQTLKGKFIYPEPVTQVQTDFAEHSLAAIAMSHGIGGSYAELEAKATELARNCYVVLIYNYRGQSGYTWDITTEFTFQDGPERTDLEFVTDRLIDGPVTLGAVDELVDEDHLGIMGVSQYSLATWLAIADYDTRDRYQAAIPYDSGPMMSQIAAPNDCLNAGLSALFDPDNVRTPQPSPTPGGPPPPTARGILWETVTYGQLAAAYLTSTPNVPFLQTAIATRDPGDELPPVTATGVPAATMPHPHVMAWASQWDTWQWTDETITGWQIVTPVPTLTPGYPNDSLYLSKGGHTGPPWQESQQETFDYFYAKVDWLNAYLDPAYDPLLTPVPTFTPVGGAGTNTPTPLPPAAVVRFVVDTFDPNSSALTPSPIFATAVATMWPPVTPNNVQLFLHNDGSGNGDLNLYTPGVETPDVIGQDYSAGVPPYNMGTAVDADPAFDRWDEHILNTNTLRVIYVSPVLAQDVTLIGPPEVKLYAAPETGYSYPIQVHARVREQLAAGATVNHFITRANACAWNATDASESGLFNGTPYKGETRVHRFKAGNRIELEVVTVDRQEYNPTHIELFMTPLLDEMRVLIYHHNLTAIEDDKSTNITLPLQLSNPGTCIFETDYCPTGGAPDAPQSEPEPTATPAPPAPLAITATLFSEYTNPGGWRAWAPEVLIECSGGQGEVTCPEDTVLTSEGINQRFVFTATDSLGTVVTDTVNNLTIDRSAPVLTSTLPETQTFCTGSTTQLDFSVTDALSGLVQSSATFNGQPAEDNGIFSLLAGPNTLRADALDAAGNHLVAEEILQVNYDETLDFPADGQTVNPLLPLSFTFQVRDACVPQGWYAGATGTLWLTGPDGVEIPAEWFGLPSGNTFTYNTLTGWYTFDADLTGLSSGAWTARTHLDDGTDHTVTFVIPGGLGGESAEGTAITAGRPSCQDGWLRPLLGVGHCR